MLRRISWLALLLPLLADLHLCLLQLLRVEGVSFCQELLPLLLQLRRMDWTDGALKRALKIQLSVQRDASNSRPLSRGP